MESRYDGKPFLKLLDSYVLDSIGELDQTSKSQLAQMEPRLRTTYKADGTWQEIVAKQMDFPDHLPERIREIWREGSDRMRAQGSEPDPIEFTHAFVDMNWNQD